MPVPAPVVTTDAHERAEIRVRSIAAAERIETAAEAHCRTNAGCRMGHGFPCRPAVGADAFERQLSHREKT